jgi:hypothetical protein
MATFAGFCASKQSNPTLMKILSIILVAIAATATAQTTKTGDFKLDQNYKVDAKGTIELRSSDAKVFITGSIRKDVHVKVNRHVDAKGIVMGEKEFSVEVEEVGGNLRIDERQSSTTVGVVGYYNEEYRIDIEAPVGVSLRIRGDDGNYTIKMINGSIDLDLDDADVDLIGCKGEQFTFRLDDGGLKMDEARGALEVSIDDADIEIMNAKLTSIDAKIDDGDFIVQTTLADNGNYFIDSQDGSIIFTVAGGGGKFDIRHDDASVRADAAFTEVEDSEDRSRYTLGIGTAKVDIRADDARVKLAKL